MILNSFPILTILWFYQLGPGTELKFQGQSIFQLASLTCFSEGEPLHGSLKQLFDNLFWNMPKFLCEVHSEKQKQTPPPYSSQNCA